jgi:UDP-N-acetyl-2-amino-2-deoxyglucuronate dehydrogenase
VTSEIGIGIIGAGNISLLHGKAIAAIPGARLRAVLGKTKERALGLAQQLETEGTTDAEAFFSRPDIQIVTICTPSGTHADLGMRAAAAGKHVLVEKPIDVSLEKARALIEACDRQGVRLGVIFQSRFLPAVTLIKRAIEGGRLGQLYVADGYVKWYRTREYYEGARWRGTKALDGGGALINQAIHTVDLVQYLAGPVASVFGFAERKRHPYIEGEDTAVAVLRFGNGAVGVLEATTSLYPGFSRRVEIHGEKGSIVLDGNDISVWSLTDSGEEEKELERLRTLPKDSSDGSSNPMNLDIDGHRQQIEDFLKAVREDRAPAVDGREGLKALEVALAVYRSADTGQLVAL